MGKGDNRRPTDDKAYGENYDRIFGHSFGHNKQFLEEHNSVFPNATEADAKPFLDKEGNPLVFGPSMANLITKPKTKENNDAIRLDIRRGGLESRERRSKANRAD